MSQDSEVPKINEAKTLPLMPMLILLIVSRIIS